jgi:hypothetical protein
METHINILAVPVSCVPWMFHSCRPPFDRSATAGGGRLQGFLGEVAETMRRNVRQQEALEGFQALCRIKSHDLWFELLQNFPPHSPILQVCASRAYDEGTTSPAEQAVSTGDRQNPSSCLSLTSRGSRIAVPPPKSPQTPPQAPPPTRDETFQHVESVRHERRTHDTSDSSRLLVALAPPEPYIKRHSLAILSRKRVQTTKDTVSLLRFRRYAYC